MIKTIRSWFRKSFFIYLCLFVILGIAAYLLLRNLDNIYLWQDEAETSLLGKNILKFGLPLAWDGKNIITQQGGQDFNNNFLWIYHPWVPFYVSAIGLKLFGITTLGARLPFVALGFLSILFIYKILSIIFSNKYKALSGVVIMSLYTPFLLASRQARYYSPGIFFTLVSIYFFIRQKSMVDYIFLLVSLTLLFYTNYLMFLPIAAGMFIYTLLIKTDFKRKLNIFFSLAITGFLTFPWLLFARTKVASDTLLNLIKPDFDIRILDALLLVNNNFFPILMILLILVYSRKNKRRYQFMILLVILFLTSIVLISYFSPKVNTRYFFAIIPIGVLFFTSFAIYLLEKKNLLIKLLSIIMILLFVFTSYLRNIVYVILSPRVTNIISFVSKEYANKISNRSGYGKKIRFEFNDYLYEITHDYNGPVEGIVKYLQENSKPNQSIIINYSDLPIIFYTDLKVLARLPRSDQLNDKLIKLPNYVLYNGIVSDWFILRSKSRSTFFDEGDFALEINKIKNQYTRISIPYPDIFWENRPDPDHHLYKTAQGEPPVVIYQLK